MEKENCCPDRYDIKTSSRHFAVAHSDDGIDPFNKQIRVMSLVKNQEKMNHQRTFGLKSITEKFRFRYIPVCLLVFVISQVCIFGIVIPKRCNYFMWLLGRCGQSDLIRSSSQNSILNRNLNSLPVCPLVPPHLQGHVDVSIDVPSWDEIAATYSMLEPGGRYRPPTCRARHRVAIIVPFRERDIHLKIFLNNIHAVLQRQQIDYGIYVVDMEKSIPFNRALLLNAGYLEAIRIYPYQCFIFHDVDLIPENDHNMYSCPENPRHMSVAIDKWNYRLPYMTIFGGVVAMTREHMEQVNGFSNIFFGWGGEDDDMYQRIKSRNMTITRYTGDVARYHMLSHRKDKGNPNRFNLLKSVKTRSQVDGINSLKYTVLKRDYRKLYTYVLISVNQTEIVMRGTTTNSAAALKKPT